MGGRPISWDLNPCRIRGGRIRSTPDSILNDFRLSYNLHDSSYCMKNIPKPTQVLIASKVNRCYVAFQLPLHLTMDSGRVFDRRMSRKSSSLPKFTWGTRNLSASILRSPFWWCRPFLDLQSQSSLENFDPSIANFLLVHATGASSSFLDCAITEP